MISDLSYSLCMDIDNTVEVMGIMGHCGILWASRDFVGSCGIYWVIVGFGSLTSLG